MDENGFLTVIGGMKVLKDILPDNGRRLYVLFVGLAPSFESIGEGHYFQSKNGRIFWQYLKEANVLQFGENEFGDDQLLSNNFGFVYLSSRPLEYAIKPVVHGTDITYHEYKVGIEKLMRIVRKYNPSIICFTHMKILKHVLRQFGKANMLVEYGFNHHLENIFKGSLVFVSPVYAVGFTKANKNKLMQEFNGVLNAVKMGLNKKTPSKMKHGSLFIAITALFLLVFFIILSNIIVNEQAKINRDVPVSEYVQSTAPSSSSYVDDVIHVGKSEDNVTQQDKDTGTDLLCTLQGKTYYSDYCSFKFFEKDGKYKLEEIGGKTFKCTKKVLKRNNEYYLVDPDIADVDVNLACFGLKRGTTVYIVHDFDYDAVTNSYMDGILVFYSDTNVRLYLDVFANGTAFYCGGGKDYPAYECFAKMSKV